MATKKVRLTGNTDSGTRSVNAEAFMIRFAKLLTFSFQSVGVGRCGHFPI